MEKENHCMSVKQAKLIVNAHKHNVHRNRKAYWGRGEWGGMGEGLEVVEEGDYIPIATPSPPE